MYKFLFIFLLGYFAYTESAVDVAQIMQDMEIVPDIIPMGPVNLLEVNYPNEVSIQPGLEYTPTQTQKVPKLKWPTEPDSYYTLIMSNVDSPIRGNAYWREMLHWLVVNIPGTAIEQGEELCPYFGAGPIPEAGLLRYILLIYKQPGLLDVSAEPHLTNTNVAGHKNFSTSAFANKFDLKVPIAGNTFEAQFDEKSRDIYKQFNIDVSW